MKKKKYGEDTVVIRIPKSRKDDVLKFLASFEVIGDFSLSVDNVDSCRDAYIRGFNDCFTRWENYQIALAYILSGNESQLPLLKDLFSGRVPDSAVSSVMEQLNQVLLNSKVDVSAQVSLAQSFLDESLDEANKLLSSGDLNTLLLLKQLKYC